MLKFKKSLRGLYMSIAVSTMTACASSTIPPVASNPPPADLAQPCPPIPELSGNTGAVILPYILELHGLYRDCAARHKALADAWPK